MKKLSSLLYLACVVCVAVPLAACGSSGSSSTSSTSSSTTTGASSGGGGATSTVDISAAPDNSLAFEQKTVTAKAGNVSIAFNNPAQIAHDVCVEGPSGDIGCTDQIAESKATLDLGTLAAGKYTFYCSVPGHRDAGMEGTLTVH